MKDEILALEKKALGELESISDLSHLERFRVAYLGTKGLLTSFMKRMRELPPEERPEFGKLANRIKADLTRGFEKVRSRLESGLSRRSDLLDVTLPGRGTPRGSLHPITQVLQEICDIFVRMGYRIVKGPNVELDYYNFEALNMPKDHPARDMQDTFYVSENVVLRTQTSPMQVRTMELQKPPVSIISPGKVYRRDSDVSHGLRSPDVRLRDGAPV